MRRTLYFSGLTFAVFLLFTKDNGANNKENNNEESERVEQRCICPTPFVMKSYTTFADSDETE